VPARVFGPSSHELLASLAPDMRSWRTSLRSLLEDSTAFSETWPRSGMTRSGIAYRLQPLAPLTRGTGSGSSPTRTKTAEDLLQISLFETDGRSEQPSADSEPPRIPTPTRGDSKSARNSTARRNKIPPTGIHAGDTLIDFVTKYPTPRASDAGKGGRGDLLAVVRTGKGSRRKEWPTPHGMPKPGQHRRPGPSGNELGRAVNEAEREMFPTPMAADGDRGSETYGRGNPTLLGAARNWPTPTKGDGLGGPGSSGREGGENLRTAAGGALNPTWVEWLMGFPLGWTALPPSATPLSRRSRSGSGDGSSNTRKVA
jgi:hypothetical protein